MCMKRTALSQTARVFPGQMKTAYPVSSKQTVIPISGKSPSKRSRTSGEMTSKGGRVSDRQMLLPFHQSTPKLFEMPLKKYTMQR